MSSAWSSRFSTVPYSATSSGRRLFADPAHARHVVRGVAQEREDVDELGGLAAVGLAEGLVRFHVELLALVRRPHHGHAGPEELPEVFVGRHDAHVRALGRRLHRERPDHVVRLHALDLDHRNVERLDDALDKRDAVAQALGHLGPVRLVLIVELVAVRFGSGERVEDDGDVLGLLVFEQLQEARREAVGGARLVALVVQERPADKGEVGAVGERKGVAEVEPVAVVERSVARAVGVRCGRLGGGRHVGGGGVGGLGEEVEVGHRAGRDLGGRGRTRGGARRSRVLVFGWSLCSRLENRFPFGKGGRPDRRSGGRPGGTTQQRRRAQRPGGAAFPLPIPFSSRPGRPPRRRRRR